MIFESISHVKIFFKEHFTFCVPKYVMLNNKCINVFTYLSKWIFLLLFHPVSLFFCSSIGIVSSRAQSAVNCSLQNTRNISPVFKWSFVVLEYLAWCSPIAVSKSLFERMFLVNICRVYSCGRIMQIQPLIQQNYTRRG